MSILHDSGLYFFNLTDTAVSIGMILLQANITKKKGNITNNRVIHLFNFGQPDKVSFAKTDAPIFIYLPKSCFF